MEGPQKRVRTEDGVEYSFGDLAQLPPEVLEVVLIHVEELADLFQVGRVNMDLRYFMKDHNIFQRWFLNKFKASYRDVDSLNDFVTQCACYRGFELHVDNGANMLITRKNTRKIDMTCVRNEALLNEILKNCRKAGFVVEDTLVEDDHFDTFEIDNVMIQKVASVWGYVRNMYQFVQLFERLHYPSFDFAVKFDCSRPFDLLALQISITTNLDYGQILENLTSGKMPPISFSTSGKQRFLKTLLKM